MSLKMPKIKSAKKDKVVVAEYNSKGEAVKPKSKKSKVFGFIFRLLLVLVLLVASMAVMGAVCFFHILNNYENIDIANTFKTLKMKETTYIYAADPETGEYKEIESLFISEDRKWISFDSIPKYFIDSTVAIEDERFFEHQGVDWPRFIWATVNSFIRVRGRFGASTITMQLVKNVTGEADATWKRKFNEVFNATYLEKIYSKEDILELYLNYVNYGGQNQGIMSACRYFYNKDPGELTLLETASIVGITNNPSIYNPYYEENREANFERAKLIVEKMFELGKISKEEYDEAMATESLDYSFTSASEETTVSIQSYYVDAVIEEVLKDLRDTYNVSNDIATKMLYQGGYKIYIPMDSDIQNIMDGYYQNRENFPTNSYTDKETGKTEYLQSAMIIMDYKNGNVLGLVGGIGEKEYNRAFNRATSAFRQVGSVIKPIAVYAPAIEYNLVDGISSLHDMPNSKEGTWPVNYTDYYRGLMPLRRALAMSLNGPTVELAMRLTPQRSYDFLTQKCGIKNLVGSGAVNDVTLSLSLGGVTDGLTVTEICAAYQIFPNEGIYNEPRFYLKVSDNLGNSVLEKNVKSNIALSPQTSFIMRDLLYELVYNGYSSGAKFNTSKGEKITCYGKTGTSTRDHDFWFCGFTSEYVGCVWIGYDSNQRIDSGESALSAKLWAKVMRSIYDVKGLHDGTFDTPTGVTQVAYCKYSGKLATDVCLLDPRNTEKDPVVVTNWVKTENVPKDECDVHHAVYLCEESGKIAHDGCPNGSVYAVALLNEFRDFIRTDLYIEDAQYLMPKLGPEAILYVSDRLPVYMNLYNNPEGWETYIGKKMPENSKVEIHLPGLPMKKVATKNVINAICTAHTPSEEPHLHPYNFRTGSLITTPTHINDEPEPEPTPSDVDSSEAPPESSDVPPDTSSEPENTSSEPLPSSEPDVTSSEPEPTSSETTSSEPEASSETSSEASSEASSETSSESSSEPETTSSEETTQTD